MKRMLFLHFFQNLIFCEILWHQEKKLHIRNILKCLFMEKNRFTGYLCGSVEAFLLCEKIWLIFAWLTLTLSFCKGIVKEVAKQTIWFLACWFFKHYSWIFLTLTSFLDMDFQVVQWESVPLAMINSWKIHRKMWFYVANHRKPLEFIIKFLKKNSRKILVLFYPVYSFFLFCFFFQVYFGEKMWLILYFSKFSR